MSSIRHEIFDKSNDPSSCPASILYYSYSPEKEKNEQNLVTHISLKPNRFFEIFRMFVIEKHDQKQLLQSYFMEYDWIWKVMVYGNVLDFYLIKRLKNIASISEIVSNTNKFINGQGINIGGGDKNSVKELLGRVYIDADDLCPYFTKTGEQKKWTIEFVNRPRDIRLYEKYLLFTKRGADNQFKAIASTSDKDIVYTHAIFGVRAFKKEDFSILKSIEALLNSNLFSYFIVQTGSSVGIEREQIHVEEKLNFPYGTSTKLVEMILLMEQVAKDKHNAELEFSEDCQQIEIKYKSLLREIDEEVLKIYHITGPEKALIDYAHEISIPLIQRRDKNRIFGALNLQNQAHKDYLAAYARIFIEHYNHIYNSDNHYFEVEVWHSNYMIGMYFKIISQPSEAENQIIWKKDENTDNLLKKFAAISISNRSQNLFVQKDIKGFEENAFYVVKPNEYKCWHRAMAYLDLSEFMKAIMDSAKQDHNL
jgi:hypothetical protein